MPRRSAASLEISPVVPGQGRAEPPPELDAVEARIWNEVIDALPDRWVDPAAQLVLRSLVAQAAVAQQRETRLRQLRALGHGEDEALDQVAVQHGITAKVVARLLTELRATPRSRLTSRAAATAAEETPVIRPWEIRATSTPSATN
jgi:hypothetical protein